MTTTLPNPKYPMERKPLHHLTETRQRVDQFVIVGRFAVRCSCGHDVLNTRNVDLDGKPCVWFTSSNDARKAAVAHVDAGHPDPRAKR